MKIIKHLLLFATLLGIGVPGAKANERDYYIYFDKGRYDYIPELEGNQQTVEEIKKLFEQVKSDESLSIENILYVGFTSPEGSYNLNADLALKRRNTVENIVRSLQDYPSELPETALSSMDLNGGVAWSQLRRWVAQSDIEYKEEVLVILDRQPSLVSYRNGQMIDARVLSLMKLRGGKPWKEIQAAYFEKMRSAVAIVLVDKKPEPEIVRVPILIEEEEPVEVEAFEIVEVAETPAVKVKEPFRHNFYIKSNAVGWVLANANLGLEVDLCRHLSLAVPVYYSAMNYFSYKWKFRTLTVQPELRYWFGDQNDKFFIGAHFGMGYYDFAFNGSERYQDHDGNTPALGGGIAVGYRMPISRNKRWKVEFTVGAGAYRVHYDTFENVKDGPLTGTYKKTFIGIDQLSVGFSYNFNLK